MTRRDDAPASQVLEVSVFGPGVGESIVVHLGAGRWMVVDSCVVDRRPVALAYLESIGVDIAEAVDLVVATHWHDDHISGIAETYRACRAARFVCSAALQSTDFLALVEATSARPMTRSSAGLEEFKGILEVLRERKTAAVRREARGPAWAQVDRILLESNEGIARRVLALSPSDASITLGLREIAGLLPVAKTTKRRLVAGRPNHTAVVLHVQVGTMCVLLGSDLEVTLSREDGWDGVLQAVARVGRAHIFKVAHHGSMNGHHPNIWTDLLLHQPHAVVTPYLRGKALPTEDDLRRLKDLTPNLHITSAARLLRPKDKDRAVERLLGSIVRERRILKKTFGQIRLRAEASGSSAGAISVETMGTASSA